MVWKSSTRSSLLVLQGSYVMSVLVPSPRIEVSTYVFDVDDGVWLAALSNAIGESVWWDSSSLLIAAEIAPSTEATVTVATSSAMESATATAVTSTTTSIASTAIAATTAVATSAVATCSVAIAAAVSTTTPKASATSSKATTATKAWSAVGEAILTDLEHAALPVVAIELRDGVLCVFWRIECDDTGALCVAIWSNVDIRTRDIACLTEQILEILPADLKRELFESQ